MASVWFKAPLARDILAGRKTDTIRAGAVRWRVGDVLSASVGPRRPFAHLKVLEVEPIRLAELPPERVRAIRGIYPTGDVFTRVGFAVDAVLDEPVSPRSASGM